jgi:hypothetical protein
MARLDDDHLNISPEVAAALGYRPRRANATPRRNARAEAQPRHAHDQVDDFPAGLFGAVGVALVLLLLICAVTGIAGMSRAGSTVTADSHPQTTAQSPEGQSAAVSEPAPQPQAPPAIETTNLETDSQQTMQSPPQPESVPDSIEASTDSDSSSAGSEKPEIKVEEAIREEPVVISQPPESEQQEKKVTLPKPKWYAEGGASAPSFQWICGGPRPFCRLDSNGVAIQGFLLQNGGVVRSLVRPNLPTPAGWGCSVRYGTELFCSVQDGQGHIIQSASYDGRSLARGN